MRQVYYNLMSDDELDRLYNTGGDYGPNAQANSLDNNFDMKSDRGGNFDNLQERGSFANLLDEDYQKLWDKKKNLVNELDNSILKSTQYQKDSFEYRLNNASSFAQYDDALSEFKASLNFISVSRLAKILQIILGEKRNVNNYGMQFSCNCIFLRYLSRFFKQIEDIQLYQEAIGVILDSSKQFYRFQIGQQGIQIMNLYLQQENPDLVSVHSLVSQFQSTQMKMAIEMQENELYKFYYNIFLDSCIRKAKINFNLFLISRALHNRQQFYLQQFQKDIEVTQGCVLDKRQLEEYLRLLIQICKTSQYLTQEHIFKVMQWLIQENEQIQRKLMGFKIIKDLIVEFRTKDKFKYILVNWLTQNRIIDNFLRDSTHSRILQQIQPIIHFLYEQGVLGDFEIIELMKYSLHSQEIFKVVQTMIGWLKIQHLFLVFEIIPFHNDRESTLFINFISTILSNPLISDENSRKRRNVIVQDNHREEGEIQAEIDENSELMQQFVKKLLHFLIQFVVQHQSNYMPILLKLISSHSKIFKDDLFNQIIKLLKNNSVCSLWIIEHWLKIETARDRGQGKYQLIITLASQGVFQLMLALLARHRFSRLVVEKALSVIIFFCRFNKPLERNIVEFLWKVLGTTGRDERERQQFFVFLKQLVRYEGSITEQSVNFIYFDILLSLVAYWFTLRVYDCLQMLFLRLNQDCKLISFEKDHYKIEKLPLIGTDKFLYIYFNCLDLKVVKKCKDFIWRLLSNAEETRQGMNLYIIGCLRKYMTYALQMVKQQQLNKRQVIVLRVFDIAEKISLQKEKQEDGKQTILNLNIQVANLHTLGSKNLMMEFNEKIILSDLRCYIGDNLNPPAKNIELWTKGKLLKGENLTLRQLKLQSGQTISVSKPTEIDIEEDKESIKQNQLETLTSIIGEQHDQEFLKFVIDKFEGENIQTIANNMFDPERLQAIEQEYKQKKTEKDEMIIEIEDTKQKVKSFGSLLVHQKDVFMLILQCLKISQNKLSGWNFIKRLPLNEDCVDEVKEYIQSGLWSQLFTNKTTEQSMYTIHILTNYIKLNNVNLKELFQDKNLGLFLKSWLSEIVNRRSEQLNNYYDMLKLMLIELQCPILVFFDQFLHKKAGSEADEQLVKNLQETITKQRKGKFQIESDVIYKLFLSLQKYTPCQKVVEQISKIYILQLIYSTNQNSFSILEHPNLSFLLLKYGKPLEFITLATSLLKTQYLEDSYLPKLVFQLLSALKYQKRSKEQKLSFASYFSCINQLLKISVVVDSRAELQVLTEILTQLRKDFSNLQEQQIVGYFKISATLIDRHFKSERGGQRKNQDIYCFAKWLLNEYLFDKNNISPFVAAKNIRKGAYQLLVRMCGYHDILNLITSSVKHIMSNFKDTNEVQGQIRTGQFLGIKNLGATCYINSLLQQLYHTTFPALLLEQDNNDDQSPIKLLQLKKLFVNLYSSIRSPVFPNDFVQTVKINGQIVRPMVQQDVNQFFISLMHDIEQAVGNKAINQTICGSLCHQIRGLEEGSEVKNVDQTFLTFMIDIKYRKNIHEAISSFSKPHFLEGENMYYSQVLHKKIRASSKTYLGKLPNLLVITLKRFYWNFQQMNRIKINDYFDFPLQLQLSRYAMPGRKQSDPHYFQYRLCGIIIHSGSAQSGHYYSLIKVGQQWFQFNDKKVTAWDIQNNLKGQCFGGNDQKSRNAYMLFYERIGAKVYGESLNKLPEKNKVLRLVQEQNQNFMLNRRIYDSNFIDFIKDLSRFDNHSSLLKLLDKIKYYRQTAQSCPIIPQILQGNINEPEILKGSRSIGMETQDLKPKGVTQHEVEMLAKTFYPNPSAKASIGSQNIPHSQTGQLFYDVQL